MMWHPAKTTVTSTRVFMAFQVNLSTPPKWTVWDYPSCSASLRSRWRDYIMYHCQLHNAPKKVKGLHLLADIISLYLNIRTTIISSKMYLYWPAETSTICRPTYSNTISFILLLYSKWHFPLIAFPSSLSEIISCRPLAPGAVIWKLAALHLCKSSANLRVHVVLSLGFFM